MNRSSVLFLAVVFIFSFSIFSASAHALSFDDIINAILFVLTGRSPSSSIQGGVLQTFAGSFSCGYSTFDPCHGSYTCNADICYWYSNNGQTGSVSRGQTLSIAGCPYNCNGFHAEGYNTATVSETTSTTTTSETETTVTTTSTQNNVNICSNACNPNYPKWQVVNGQCVLNPCPTNCAVPPLFDNQSYCLQYLNSSSNVSTIVSTNATTLVTIPATTMSATATTTMTTTTTPVITLSTTTTSQIPPFPAANNTSFNSTSPPALPTETATTSQTTTTTTQKATIPANLGSGNCDVYVSGPNKLIKYFTSADCSSFDPNSISTSDISSLFGGIKGTYTLIVASPDSSIGAVYTINLGE